MKVPQIDIKLQMTQNIQKKQQEVGFVSPFPLSTLNFQPTLLFIDFLYFIRKKPSYISNALTTKQGHFLFLDKNAKEHFQGCLNNLFKKTIFDLMVTHSRNKFLLAHQSSTFAMKYTIYSKNTKRKFQKIIDASHTQTFLRKSSSRDLFYRYLKSLTSRVLNLKLIMRDVDLKVLQNLEIDYNFDEQLKGKEVWEMQVVYLQTRLSKQLQQIRIQRDDPVIQKFDKQVRKKIKKRRKLSQQQYQ